MSKKPAAAIKPVIVEGPNPQKWIRVRLTDSTGLHFDVMRADSISEYHLNIYNRFEEEIHQTEFTIVEICDGGKVNLHGPKQCLLFGYSTHFRIPDPNLPTKKQLTVRKETKNLMETHGYEVELGEIWLN